MKNTEHKIPALRFPEFSGEWEEKRLGEISEIIMGQSPDSAYYNEKGIGEVLIQGNADIKNRETIKRLWTTQITKKCLFNDLILTVRAPVGSIAKATFTACIGRGVCAIRPKPTATVNFLFQTLIVLEPSWRRLEQGSTFTSVNSTDINNLKIKLPHLLEQQKIADFLSAVDKRLQLLKDKKTKLEEYKRGVMQRIFSQELRFTRPDGTAYPDWEEKRIGDVFTFKQGVQCPVEEQSLEREDGRVRFIRIIDLTSSNEPARYIRSFNQKDIIKSDDLFMVRYGTPGLVGYGFEGVVANNLFRLIPVTDVYNKYYYYVLLFLNKKITSLASSSTMPALNFKSLGMLEIPEPHIDEQRQIADFLSVIDNKISLLSKQIQSTEQYKKGLLQQMFV